MALHEVLLSSEGFELLRLTSTLDLPRPGLLALGSDKEHYEREFLSPIQCLGSRGRTSVLASVWDILEVGVFDGPRAIPSGKFNSKMSISLINNYPLKLAMRHLEKPRGTVSGRLVRLFHWCDFVNLFFVI